MQRLHSRRDWRDDVGMSNRPQKITFAEMREQKGLRGNLIYCADYHCSHSTAISADRWPDDMRLSDIEPLFVCKACGQARRRRQAGLLLPYPPPRFRGRWSFRLLSGRSISSYEKRGCFPTTTPAQPQTVQIASPVCGFKNFSSVRLYSAPQLH